jgi:hypothetical protein
MSAGGSLLAAVDVGTTGARAAAIDLSGTLVAEARRPYRTRAPQTGWAEQDAAEWGEHAVAALAALSARLPHPERVAGIGLTGQCPTVVPIGADGRPGALRQLWESRPADGPDGFGIARSGTIYVALLLPNQIAAIGPDGTEKDRSPTSGFDNPSSVQFLGNRLIVANQSYFAADPAKQAVLDVWAGEPGLRRLVPRNAGFRK